MKPLTTDQKTLLGRILADTDVLWTPFRCTRNASNGAAAATSERRQRFAKRGVPLQIGGDVTARQQGNRTASGLAKAGLIVIVGSNRDRGVLLTEFGDNYARSMFPTKRVDESWGILQGVAKFRDGPQGVLEFDLLDIGAGVPPDSYMPKLQKLEDEALPLLANGLLATHSDTEGRLGYSLTAKGRAAGPKPRKPAGMPAYEPKLADEFIERYVDGLSARRAWLPSHRSAVFIPSSAGDWPKRPTKADG